MTPDLLAVVLVVTVLSPHGISTETTQFPTAAICQSRADGAIQDARFRNERAIAGCVRAGTIAGRP